MNSDDHDHSHRDDELELVDLEQELAMLTPAPLGYELASRVESSLSLATAPPVEANVVRGFFSRYSQAAAAAMLVFSSALLFLVTKDHSGAPRETAASGGGTTAEGSGFLPVENSSRIFEGRDGGVMVDNGRPYRQVQIHSEDQENWSDPSTGAHLKVKRPREEKVLIPLPVY